MIIEDARVNGIRTDLAYLDEVSSKIGFVRWQWEYRRATYDYQIDLSSNHDVYYLRINTRAIQGKLESPDAILQIEAVYIGMATFPHGMNYDVPIPDDVLAEAKQKILSLYQGLKDEQLIEDVMVTDVPSIPPDATLYDAALSMKNNRTGILAVVKDDQLVGVITERDLTLRGYAEKHGDTIAVEQILPSSVHSVSEHSSITEALRMMVQNKLSSVPVVREGILVGVVTLDDLAAKDYFG